MSSATKDPTFENALAFAPGPHPDSRVCRAHEGDVARRVRQEMEALGLEDVRVDDAGNVIGRGAGAGDGPLVRSSTATWTWWPRATTPSGRFPPSPARCGTAFLHGRGAMDIKGPLALQTYAAAALAGRAPGDVIVAHTVLEERGGLGMKHLLHSGT